MVTASPPDSDTDTEYRVKTTDKAVDGYVPGDELLKVEGLHDALSRSPAGSSSAASGGGAGRGRS